jgi:hypothetical protein
MDVNNVITIVGIVVGGLLVLGVASLLIWLVAVKLMFKQFDKSSKDFFKDF